jgi:hypothetical protein
MVSPNSLLYSITLFDSYFAPSLSMIGWSIREAQKTARTAHPERHFVPGIEASRWG